MGRIQHRWLRVRRNVVRNSRETTVSFIPIRKGVREWKPAKFF